MFGKLQKFLSFMCQDVQKEVQKGLEFHQKRIKKQINEYEQMYHQGQHWEIVNQKNEVKMLKAQMGFICAAYND